MRITRRARIERIIAIILQYYRAPGIAEFTEDDVR